MWSTERKMKGSAGTDVSGTRLLNGAHVDAVQVDDAEAGLLDRVLLLAELRANGTPRSCMRPSVCFSSSSPIYLTASTVG